MLLSVISRFSWIFTCSRYSGHSYLGLCQSFFGIVLSVKVSFYLYSSSRGFGIPFIVFRKLVDPLKDWLWLGLLCCLTLLYCMAIYARFYLCSFSNLIAAYGCVFRIFLSTIIYLELRRVSKLRCCPILLLHRSLFWVE